MKDLIISRVLPLAIGISFFCLSGCDQTNFSGGTIGRKSGGVFGTGAARQRVSKGLRCVQLLNAIATASTGPLRDDLEKYDLDSVGPDLAARWVARLKFDVNEAGMPADEIDKLMSHAPAIVLDEAEIRQSADEAFACGADVSGSHGG